MHQVDACALAGVGAMAVRRSFLVGVPMGMFPIGAALRVKRRVAGRYLHSEARQHRLEYVIRFEQHPIAPDFKGDMAVSHVVGGP